MIHSDSIRVQLYEEAIRENLYLAFIFASALSVFQPLSIMNIIMEGSISSRACIRSYLPQTFGINRFRERRDGA